MFHSWFFIATVAATAAHIRLVSSFQPGSDYDGYRTTNLYNCTGRDPESNVTVPNVVDTLPQVEPCEGQQGWEQWTLFLHGTLSAVLRWNQGDPSLSASVPAHLDVLIVDVNGTTVQIMLEGAFSYTDDKDVKKIAIGDNVLTWGTDALWYNVSVSVDGYQLTLDSFSATRDAFHPNVGYYNGLLDDSDESGGWFGSVPLIRGHATGSLSTPQGQNITLDGLSSLKHIFSETPLPEYITKYTSVTAWGYSTTFYDTHVFYQTETIDGTLHEAAYLGRALPTPGQQGVFSSAWATYAVTDDYALYNLTINATTNAIDASFPGCTNTSNVPYIFHILPTAQLGTFTDLGGGQVSYYSIKGTTTAASPSGDIAVNGTLAGVLEVYEAPPSTDDCE